MAEAKRTPLPTIMETCDERGWPYPVSHADLVAFVQRCNDHDIVTNCTECRWWQEYSEETLDCVSYFSVRS